MLWAALGALGMSVRAAGQDAATTRMSKDDPGQDVQPPKEPAEPAEAQAFGVTGDWWGWRRKLAERGIAVDVSLVADGTANLRGGLDTADRTWRRMLDATVTLDTKPLLGLEGGTVFIDFQHADGPNPSDELVGDVQGLMGWTACRGRRTRIGRSSRSCGISRRRWTGACA